MTSELPFHREAVADIGAPARLVFAMLDDPRRFAVHVQ